MRRTSPRLGDARSLIAYPRWDVSCSLTEVRGYWRAGAAAPHLTTVFAARLKKVTSIGLKHAVTLARSNANKRWEMTNHMTTMDLTNFRDALRIKQAELSGKSLSLESIAIERSADAIEEAEFRCSRELAIVSLNRDSAIRRKIEMALIRINNDSFGVCLHCDREISTRRLEAVPWTPFCIRCQEAADRGDESVLESVEPALLDAA